MDADALGTATLMDQMRGSVGYLQHKDRLRWHGQETGHSCGGGESNAEAPQ